jgi:hypothetical protein
MDFVDITLAGREYKLRYTADDVQDICRRLTPFQPMGAGKVTPTLLGGLLLQLDPDAFQFCLWAGLRHITEYKNIDPPTAQKLIREHIKRGGQYTDFRIGIFKGFVKCGLADFAPIVQILEDEAAQRAEDGAIDVPAPEQADAEADQGNGLTPSSTSQTRSSTPFSLAVGSE